MMRRLLGALARFEKSWVADALGAISLFGMVYAGLWIGTILGFK